MLDFIQIICAICEDAKRIVSLLFDLIIKEQKVVQKLRDIQKRVLTTKTMKNNEKEPKTSKHRSYFVTKVLFFVFCVTVYSVALLAVHGRQDKQRSEQRTLI